MCVWGVGAYAAIYKKYTNSCQDLPTANAGEKDLASVGARVCGSLLSKVS